MITFYNTLFRFFSILLLLSCFSNYCYAQAVCPQSNSVCISRAPFPLTGGSPTGGTYSGPGVSDGIFNPTLAGKGIHKLTYSYIANNQITSCNFYYEVYTTIYMNCILERSRYCIGGSPQPLSDCGPSVSGATTVFSGPGITNNIFYPAVAGIGTHQYTMTVSDSYGCSGGPFTSSVEVTEGAPPVITCPNNISVSNSTSAPFLITGGSTVEPADVFYYGIGVRGDAKTFDPSVSGNGIFNINCDAYPIDASINEVCFSHCNFKINVGSLPVKLISFQAQRIENNIKLTWETSSETNFDYFEVERSADIKKGFEKIDQLSGDNSNGVYTYLDQTAEAGKPWYYRLKMIDMDGTFAYSKISWALIEGKEELLVYPNPASRQLSIQSPTELIELQLINSSGIEAITIQVEKVKNKNIALPSLPPGIYLIKTKTIRGTYKYSKVMIE